MLTDIHVKQQIALNLENWASDNGVGLVVIHRQTSRGGTVHSVQTRLKLEDKFLLP